MRKIKNQNKYRCRIHETKPEICREFPKVIPNICKKCQLNFVKYFKDAILADMPLEEFFKWTSKELDGFLENVFKKVKRCPKCGEPISLMLINEWALENCPAVKEQILKNRRDARQRVDQSGHGEEGGASTRICGKVAFFPYPHLS